MPTTQNIPAHASTFEEPESPRDLLVDSIALEAATGSTTAQLAVRFGYTYGGMLALQKRDGFKERVGYYGKRLEDMRLVAARKILLHTPNLLANELAVALQGEDPATGTIDVDKASKPASQKARQYLLDKVMPSVTKVETTVETINAPETKQVLTALRDVLQRVASERTVTTTNYSILDSPHVLEGTDALPSPLLEKQP